MSKESRRRKLETSLRQFETEFTVLLVSELRRCAAGEWGLFGQNENLLQQSAPHLLRSLPYPQGRKLIKLGQEITALRKDLGNPGEFEPYARYLEYRSLRSSNTPAEPKLAAQLLAELDAG